VALTGDFARDPAKKTQWRAFLRRNRLKSVPEELGDVVGFLAGFLLPVAATMVGGLDFIDSWRAPGPWSRAPR